MFNRWTQILFLGNLYPACHEKTEQPTIIEPAIVHIGGKSFPPSPLGLTESPAYNPFPFGLFPPSKGHVLLRPSHHGRSFADWGLSRRPATFCVLPGPRISKQKPPILPPRLGWLLQNKLRPVAGYCEWILSCTNAGLQLLSTHHNEFRRIKQPATRRRTGGKRKTYESIRKNSRENQFPDARRQTGPTHNGFQTTGKKKKTYIYTRGSGKTPINFRLVVGHVIYLPLSSCTTYSPAMYLSRQITEKDKVCTY